MSVALEVKQGVISIPSTASVKAMKAYIETGGIVLGTVSTRLIPEKMDLLAEIKYTYDRIKALSAILSINSLGRPWWAEI